MNKAIRKEQQARWPASTIAWAITMVFSIVFYSIVIAKYAYNCGRLNGMEEGLKKAKELVPTIEENSYDIYEEEVPESTSIRDTTGIAMFPTAVYKDIVNTLSAIGTSRGYATGEVLSYIDMQDTPEHYITVECVYDGTRYIVFSYNTVNSSVVKLYDIDLNERLINNWEYN